MPLILIQRSYTLFERQQTLVDFRTFHSAMDHISAKAFLEQRPFYTNLVLASASPRSAPRSLPARSMKLSFPIIFLRLFNGLSKIWRMACDRDESELAPVLPENQSAPGYRDDICRLCYLYFALDYRIQTPASSRPHF